MVLELRIGVGNRVQVKIGVEIRVSVRLPLFHRKAT